MSFSKKYMEETKSNGIFFTQSTIENDDEEEQPQSDLSEQAGYLTL